MRASVFGTRGPEMSGMFPPLLHQETLNSWEEREGHIQIVTVSCRVKSGLCQKSGTDVQKHEFKKREREKFCVKMVM